jgi:hypothetical protein
VDGALGPADVDGDGGGGGVAIGGVDGGGGVNASALGMGEHPPTTKPTTQAKRCIAFTSAGVTPVSDKLVLDLGGRTTPQSATLNVTWVSDGSRHVRGASFEAGDGAERRVRWTSPQSAEELSGSLTSPWQLVFWVQPPRCDHRECEDPTLAEQ